jgi:hypothetical protein
MKTQISKRNGLPKFDTIGWLSIGIFFSLLLFIVCLWSALSLFGEPFFPSKFGDIMGMIVGLGLGIHCVDMIAYHRKNNYLRSNDDNYLQDKTK